MSGGSSAVCAAGMQQPSTAYAGLLQLPSEQGDVGALGAALRSYAEDVNAQDSDGSTALHAASAR